jgi:hypothetical protein
MSELMQVGILLGYIFNHKSFEMNKGIFVEIIIYLFVFLFAYASISKLLDFQNFNIQLNKSPLVAPFSKLLVLGLPALEILISVILLYGRARLYGLYASFTLMVLFTAYIFTILHFSRTIPCSCGGILALMGWKTHFYFNVLFVLLASAAIFLYPKSAEQQR